MILARDLRAIGTSRDGPRIFKWGGGGGGHKRSAHITRWVIPVLPKGELEVLLDAAIDLSKRGKGNREKQGWTQDFQMGEGGKKKKISAHHQLGNPRPPQGRAGGPLGGCY